MLSKNVEFEDLARKFMLEHPEIVHEWRVIRGVLGIGIARVDLICTPGHDNEVFASLSGSQITVGCKAEDTDFETWGRKISQKDVEREAFEHFVALLKVT